MDNISQITTTFTCQYYLSKKKIIIRSSSEHINEFLSVIGAEYSKILDGYVLETDKTFIDIIGMHCHIIKCIENLYQQYSAEIEDAAVVQEGKNKDKATASCDSTLRVEKNKSIDQCEGNKDKSSSFETLEDSLSLENNTNTIDNINGYLLCINNLDWVLYFSEDLDENAMLKSKLFRGSKIKYNKIFQGYTFENEKNMVKKLEKHGYFPVNGIFYSDEKNCYLYLSNHMDALVRKKEIEKIKKLSARFNKKSNLYVISIDNINSLFDLGYIHVV